jgi:hypothetical protein
MSATEYRASLAEIRAFIESRPDVKSLFRLVESDDCFYFLIEPSFLTFPVAVIGRISGDGATVWRLGNFSSVHAAEVAWDDIVPSAASPGSFSLPA